MGYGCKVKAILSWIKKEITQLVLKYGVAVLYNYNCLEKHVLK